MVIAATQHLGMDKTRSTHPIPQHGIGAVAASTTRPRSARPALEVAWARHADEVRAAQRLRHRVFAEEMGAQLRPLPVTPPGLDIDAFDAHCEHLIVRAAETDAGPARVVGTYRVLTSAAAIRAGGWYSETEFDLAPLEGRLALAAELGRSCIDPEHRQGGVILMLWSSLAEFMLRNGLDRMFGCASVPMHDGGHAAASLWRRLSQGHLVAPERRVSPSLPLPVDDLDGSVEAEVPPLLKGYLRCGARLLGAPAWDPDFGVADLPLMLELTDLPHRYNDRFAAR
jgi:putative hemolysin